MALSSLRSVLCGALEARKPPIHVLTSQFPLHEKELYMLWERDVKKEKSHTNERKSCFDIVIEVLDHLLI